MDLTARRKLLLVQLDSGPQADVEEETLLVEHLRRAILDLDVDSVDATGSDSAPIGAKGDSVVLSTLAVSLAPVIVNQLMKALQTWVSQRGNTSITVTSGTDQIVIKGPLSKEQHKVIAEFIHRQENEHEDGG